MILEGVKNLVSSRIYTVSFVRNSVSPGDNRSKPPSRGEALSQRQRSAHVPRHYFQPPSALNTRGGKQAVA